MVTPRVRNNKKTQTKHHKLKTRKTRKTRKARKARKARKKNQKSQTKLNTHKHKKERKAGVLGREESVALLQSLSKITDKHIPPEIVKSITDHIHPKLKERVKNELLKRTKNIREKIEEEEEDDMFEEDNEGTHFRTDFGCMGCESGIDNTYAHCRACREGRL